MIFNHRMTFNSFIWISFVRKRKIEIKNKIKRNKEKNEVKRKGKEWKEKENEEKKKKELSVEKLPLAPSLKSKPKTFPE